MKAVGSLPSEIMPMRRGCYCHHANAKAGTYRICTCPVAKQVGLDALSASPKSSLQCDFDGVCTSACPNDEYVPHAQIGNMYCMKASPRAKMQQL